MKFVCLWEKDHEKQNAQYSFCMLFFVNFFILGFTLWLIIIFGA